MSALRQLLQATQDSRSQKNWGRRAVVLMLCFQTQQKPRGTDFRQVTLKNNYYFASV